jgi:hypothetical protein
MSAIRGINPICEQRVIHSFLDEHDAPVKLTADTERLLRGRHFGIANVLFWPF